MKKILIILLLLLPVVYAQDFPLEARKASLDLQASRFLLKMNAAIDYGNSRMVDTTGLNSLRDMFQERMSEMATVISAEDLMTRETQMRNLSDEFRKTVRKVFEKPAELKAIKIDESALGEKRIRWEEESKKVLLAAYSSKIGELNSEGNNTDIKLLSNFKKESAKVENLTPSSNSTDTKETLARYYTSSKSVASTIINFFSEKIQELNKE